MSQAKGRREAWGSGLAVRSRAPDQGTWSQGDGICGEDDEWTRVIETGQGIRSREPTEERVTENKVLSASHFRSSLVRGSLMRLFAGVPVGIYGGRPSDQGRNNSERQLASRALSE